MNPDDATFLTGLWDYYDSHGRHDLPWRLTEPGGSFDAYKILVSELMLQQTQVSRVIPKFETFINQFPNLAALAAATVGDVLKAWSGLGYNRRAKFLWQATQQVAIKHSGQLPQDLPGLVALPGIGPNTAGAIMAYAYNVPAIFIETNIRTVYIHHYFSDQQGIVDAQLRPIIERTLDRAQPRSFYWALMDYGSYLKQEVGNLNRRSASYARQRPFAGSLRQIRGQVIRRLTERSYDAATMAQSIPDPRLDVVLAALESEGMIVKNAEGFHLA